MKGHRDHIYNKKLNLLGKIVNELETDMPKTINLGLKQGLKFRLSYKPMGGAAKIVTENRTVYFYLPYSPDFIYENFRSTVVHELTHFTQICNGVSSAMEYIRPDIRIVIRSFMEFCAFFYADQYTSMAESQDLSQKMVDFVEYKKFDKHNGWNPVLAYSYTRDYLYDELKFYIENPYPHDRNYILSIMNMIVACSEWSSIVSDEALLYIYEQLRKPIHNVNVPENKRKEFNSLCEEWDKAVPKYSNNLTRER